jgi:hypothetical protein
MSEQNYNDIQSYIKEQTDKANKRFRTGLVVRSVAVVVACGYLVFLNGQTGEMLEEENLATIIVSEAKHSVPMISNTMKQTLADLVPQIVGQGIDLIIDESVPRLQAEATALFDDYTDELVSYGSMQGVDVFEEVVKHHKDTLAARAKQEQGWYTTDRIAAEISMDMERRIGMHMTNRYNLQGQESGADKLDKSYVALRNLNDRLKGLASSENPTRKEVLGRRFISSWWNVMGGVEDAIDRVN